MIDYEEEFRSLGHDNLSKVLKAHIINLEKADSLCSRCKLTDGMLCSGSRPVYIKDQSVYYKYPRIEVQSCNKYKAKRKEELYRRRLLASSVPPDFANKVIQSGGCVPFSIQDNYIYAGDSMLSTQCRMSLSPVPIRTLWTLVVSAIQAGYRAKYLYPPIVVQAYAKKKDNLIADFIDGCDWLVVEHFDYHQGSEAMQELLTSMVAHRVNAGLPILIRLSDSPTPRNALEGTLYREIRDWSEPVLLI